MTPFQKNFAKGSAAFFTAVLLLLGLLASTDQQSTDLSGLITVSAIPFLVIWPVMSILFGLAVADDEERNKRELCHRLKQLNYL